MKVNTSRMMSLNNGNWRIWKGKIFNLLYHKKMHAPLKDDDAKPKYTTDKKLKLLNQQCLGFIL